MTNWEEYFTRWSTGPSPSENERAENAERLIREAIKESDKLQNRNITVFAQGSYRNRVNVRKDSDVDIGVLCFDTFFPEYPDDNTKMILNSRHSDATYTYYTFKNEIEEALIKKFGTKSVSRGNKSFDIHENSYRLEADVAAFFEHRRYTSSEHYLSGVELIPDNYDPARVRNWPEQHYANGVNKNDRTNRKYKRVVRVFKSLCNQMAKDNIISAQRIPSFLCECLIWNTTETLFVSDQYYHVMRVVLAHLFNATLTENTCNEWGEVSELKYLFRPSQPWTRNDAHVFISDAWDYIGYK